MHQVLSRIFLIVTLGFTGSADAMTIFGKKIMFSEVIGQVTLNGVPIKDASIERYYRWSWDDRKVTDFTTTNAQGRFNLPVKEKNAFFSRLIPHEPAIFQQIIIQHQGKQYTAWQHTKHNYTRNGELKGIPIRLKCELSNEPKFTDDYYGICTIEN